MVKLYRISIWRDSYHLGELSLTLAEVKRYAVRYPEHQVYIYGHKEFRIADILVKAIRRV